MTKALRFIADRYLVLPLGAVAALAWANSTPESYFAFAHRWSFAVNDVEADRQRVNHFLSQPLLSFEFLDELLTGIAFIRAQGRGKGSKATVGLCFYSFFHHTTSKTVAGCRLESGRLGTSPE